MAEPSDEDIDRVINTHIMELGMAITPEIRMQVIQLKELDMQMIRRRKTLLTDLVKARCFQMECKIQEKKAGLKAFKRLPTKKLELPQDPGPNAEDTSVGVFKRAASAHFIRTPSATVSQRELQGMRQLSRSQSSVLHKTSATLRFLRPAQETSASQMLTSMAQASSTAVGPQQGAEDNTFTIMEHPYAEIPELPRIPDLQEFPPAQVPSSPVVLPGAVIPPLPTPPPQGKDVLSKRSPQIPWEATYMPMAGAPSSAVSPLDSLSKLEPPEHSPSLPAQMKSILPRRRSRQPASASISKPVYQNLPPAVPPKTGKKTTYPLPHYDQPSTWYRSLPEDLYQDPHSPQPAPPPPYPYE